MARIPYPTNIPADFVESQRPQELPEEYRHLNQQAARNVYRVLAHEPALIEILRDYINVIWDQSNLTNSQRELVILSAARGMDSAYEWHQHVRIALLEGMTPDEIYDISENDLDDFDETEATLVCYARAAAQRNVTDGDVEALHNTFNVETVIGVTILVGVYVALEIHLNAFDVETEEPFVGWDLTGLE